MIFNCIICNQFSFEVICKKCQKEFLKPEIKFKDDIVNFYKFDEINFLLQYKYEKFGDSVFNILAKNSFKIFAKKFKEKAFVIPIDDKTDKGFSHTAILAKSMKTKHLTPLFSTLHSKNNFQYAGKSLEERLNNPRNFEYKGPKNIDVILVDDITTTELTLKEAKNTLQKNEVNVLLSVVLAR